MRGRATWRRLPGRATMIQRTGDENAVITKAGKGGQVCLKGRATKVLQITEAGNHASQSGQRNCRKLQGRARAGKYTSKGGHLKCCKLSRRAAHPVWGFKILKDPDGGLRGTSAGGGWALGAYPVQQHCNYDCRPNGVRLCAMARAQQMRWVT